MDREVNLDELLQQRLSRRALFRNAGVAGISLSALLQSSLGRADALGDPPRQSPDGSIAWLWDVPIPGALAFDIAVQGDFAYVGTSEGLAILDITDSYNPFVRSTLPLSGSPYLGFGIVVKSSFAYVASQSRGIHVVNINNPDVPLVLTRTTDGGKLFDLALKDNTLYAADWNSGLRVYDISSPTQITLTKRIGLPAWKNASADASWLPRLAAGMTTGNAKTAGVTVVGNRLVATESGYGRVYLYDISSAQNPVFKATHYAPFVRNSVVDEAADYIYLFGGYNSSAYSGLYSVPLSKVEAEVSTRSDTCGAACQRFPANSTTDRGGIAVFPDLNRVLYAGGRGNGELHVFDSTAPGDLVELANYPLGPPSTGSASPQPMNFVNRGDHFFVAAGAIGVQVHQNIPLP